MANRRIGCHQAGGAGSRTFSIQTSTRPGWPEAVLILTIAGVSAAGPSAIAQDEELEQIIVTGSRIARPDFESASPVVTISEERFEQTGSAAIETTLNSMPQFVGNYSGTTNFSNAGGQALLSLRGLNEWETLVLVDGRRLVPANGYGVPDLNLIPPALVERVEVLTGGASAVYGSDAMAGVVNVHLVDRYEGLEFGGEWGQTDYGDGQTYTATVTGGTSFSDGRGSVISSLGYSRRDQIDQGARKFSRVALGYYGPGTDGIGPHGDFLPEGSPNIEEGRAFIVASDAAFGSLFERYGYPAGTVPYQTQFGFNNDGTLFTRGNGDPDSVANFRGVEDPLTFSDRNYTYNYAPTNALQLPLERLSAFVNASFDVNEFANLYAQGIYGDYTVNTQQAPTPVATAYMPTTNPYISADLKLLLDSRSNPDARLRISKRTKELGPRIYENRYDTYQVTLGSRGTVFSDWQYNAYAQYGASDRTEYLKNNVNVAKFEELLYAPDGGKEICGGMDPFGLDSISGKCARYMAVDLVNKSKAEQLTAEISLSGTPLHLPAGPMSTVFGVFFKKDMYSLRPDDLADTYLPDGRPIVAGWTGGQGDVDADDQNVDLYVEALVPLIADAPGIRSLQTVLGYRYSDYESAGGVSSYKAELLYEPVDPVHFRGSYQRAVRAPSVFELYNPQLIGTAFINPPDPCSVGSAERTGPDAAAVEQLCVKQGLPVELLSTFDYEDSAVEGFYGGNPDLKPEQGTTYTVGVVLTSSFEHEALRNLQLSLDWYDIHIRDAIYQYSADRFVPECYDPKYNPNFDVTNRYCSYFSRDPETGVIVDAYEISRNIGGVEIAGLDFQLNWHMTVGPGDVGVTWLASWLDKWVFQDSPDTKGTNYVDTGSWPASPRWKWNLDSQYQVGGYTAGIIWQYFGSFHSWDHLDFVVPATNFADLTMAYEFKEGKSLSGLTVRIGVNNLFNQGPRIFPDWLSANTDPTAFDVLGRRYFVSMNYAFGRGGR